jgi:hypothetical protein
MAGHAIGIFRAHRQGGLLSTSLSGGLLCSGLET